MTHEITIKIILVGMQGIENDFKLTKKWQGGLILSGSFIASSLSSPLIGFLADRYNRKHVKLICIIVWLIGSLASSFMQVGY